jgi:hypothetical protein
MSCSDAVGYQLEQYEPKLYSPYKSQFGPPNAKFYGNPIISLDNKRMQIGTLILLFMHFMQGMHKYVIISYAVNNNSRKRDMKMIKLERRNFERLQFETFIQSLLSATSYDKM